MTKKVLLALATVVLFCMGMVAAQGATHSVSINNNAFTPASISVSVGDTVTWANQDDRPHSVTSTGKFDSGFLDVGKSFSFTFAAAGTYSYFCKFHDEMQGTVVVAAAATPAPVDSQPPASGAPAPGASQDPSVSQPGTGTDTGTETGTPSIGDPTTPDAGEGSATVTVTTMPRGGRVVAVGVKAGKVVFKVVKRHDRKRMQMVIDGDVVANLRVR